MDHDDDGERLMSGHPILFCTKSLFTAAFTLFAFLPQNVAAQGGELERIKPQKLPQSAQPPAPQPQLGAESDSVSETHDVPLGVDLVGIAFWNEPNHVERSGLLVDRDAARSTDGLLISALPIPDLQTPEFSARLKPYRGIALTTGVIENLKTEVSKYYRSLGRPFVTVNVPPQDISSGIVQMVVVEARVGTVSVEGNQWFDDQLYRAALRVQPGDTIEIERLNEDTDWINRNAFRNTTIVTRKGQEFGETDLVLKTNERYPLRVYGGYDNYGSDTSGKDRLMAGFNWGNAFNMGHELNYQHTRSVGTGSSKAHSGSYVVPLPWRDILSVSASYSKSNPDLGALFNNEGISWSLQPTYTIPLKKRKDYTHELSVSLPLKVSDNTLEFSATPITNNKTHVVQMEVGYTGNWKFKTQKMGFNVSVIGSPGGVTKFNKDSAFNTSRSGAQSRYGILRGGLSYTTNLHEGIGWSTTARAQLASENLLGSEQFDMAGVSAVRGYENGLVYRDHGVMVRNELSAPIFSVLDQFSMGASLKKKYTLPADSLAPFVFVDAAAGQNVNPLQGEQRRVYLASTGAGMRYNLGPLVSLDMAYGWQMTDNPPALNSTSSRLHLTLTLGF